MPTSQTSYRNRDSLRKSTARANLAKALKERERRCLKRDLAVFAQSAWRVLEPETPLRWNWHLSLLCEYLSMVRSRSLRRLIVNVPPQTMKSRLVTVFYPCWTWATIPSRRFMAASYAASLSVKHSLNAESCSALIGFSTPFRMS